MVAKEVNCQQPVRTDPSNKMRCSLMSAQRFSRYSARTLPRSMVSAPTIALKLIAECGDNLSVWPSAKHFTAWLCLALSNKISGGKVLSARTRRTCRSNRGTNRYSARRLLQTALSTHRQGQGSDRHGAQDRSAVLQRDATRDALCRSGRVLLRDPIPCAGDCQSAPASQGL